MSWIGQYSCGALELTSFRHHLATYVPRIFKFYRLTPEAEACATQIFDDASGISRILKQLAERTQSLESFSVTDNFVHLKMCKERLETEIKFLKQQGIARLITLTEQHHSKDVLSEHFALHHIGIEDLNVPQMEQVHQLAKVMTESVQKEEKIAVHCLAGIGRTSTMLLAAHLLMGDTFDSLRTRIATRNPSFVLTGAQGEFVTSVAQRGSSLA